MKQTELFAKIGVLIFLYYLVYAFYVGLLHPIPAPGDSVDYHIPISQSILNGSFLYPPPHLLPSRYYPGSSEAINSLLILLHIPLTISNLVAIIALFFCLLTIGKRFTLDFYLSLLFAITICSLTAIFRWANAVSIDVWMAVFFVWSISLLEQPKKSFRYFLVLGFVIGMLIGSKYTSVVFVLLFLVLYIRTFSHVVSLARILIFLIPITILGLFWYVRNGLIFGNPVYPLCVFHLPCTPNFFTGTVIVMLYTHTGAMLNALFGEYKLWLFSPLIVGVIWYLRYKKKITLTPQILRLAGIGIASLLFFLSFPTTTQTWIMVSTMRYSYPVFIPFILLIFLLAKQFKQETILGYFVIGNMILMLSFSYYPKLLFIYLPVALISFTFLDRLNQKKKCTA